MKKPLVYSLVGLVVLVIIIFAATNSQKSSPQTPPNSTPTQTVTPLANPATTPPAAKTPVSPTKKPAAQPKVLPISITAPLANDQLVINKNNTIQWSRQPGTTGGVYLINVSNNSVVGWITPTIISSQTSYTWDTQYISISRESGLKNPVLPGRYIIKIKLDNPQLEIQSDAFSIVYASEVKPILYETSIQNLSFSPNSLTVTQGKGTIITIKNLDTVAHKIIPTGFGVATLLNSGESMTIETTNFPSGQYSYYSEKYPSARFTVTVK